MILDKNLRTLVLGDERWTLQNKLMGLRGVCTFWERDLEILKEDDVLIKEKTFRQIRILSDEVRKIQYELVSILRGGQQRIRNILSSDFKTQLAYQNLPPEKILENLEHETFVLNKRRDLILNKRRIRLKELSDIMHEIARIKERTQLNFTNEKHQFEIQRILNLIQKEKLKFNSAKTTENTLIRTIQRLEMDMDYFDSVLKMLEADAVEQAKCVALTIQLGQKVAEEMGAHKVETQQIEITIRNSMRDREETVRFVKQLYTDIAERTRVILRTDSGTSINMESDQLDKQKNILRRELDAVEAQLKSIKFTAMCDAYDDIMPSFERQEDYKEKLLRSFRHHLRIRDTFKKKKRESEIILEQMEHIISSKGFSMKKEKDGYINLLEETSKNRMENDRLLEKDGKLHVDIIKGSRGLIGLLTFMGDTYSETIKVETLPVVNEDGEMERLPFSLDAIAQLKLISRKCEMLMRFITETLTKEEIQWAKDKLMERISENCRKQGMIEIFPEPPTIEAEEIDDQIPTRQDLKSKAFKLLEFMEKNTGAL